MKVVLREDVEKLGKRGDVVKVAAGYGRNFLLPKKLAYEATAGNLKLIEHEKRAKDLRDARIRKDFEAVARSLSGLSLTVAKRVGENEALFGSVTAQDIADLIAAKGIEIDKRKVQLDEPIKHLGEHDVKVKLHPEVLASVRLLVTKEG